MDERRLQRIGGGCGIAFVVLSLAVVPFSVAPPPLPTIGASGADFAAWYAAHRVGFLVGNWLGVAAFVPGFVQLAVLAAAVRKREGETPFFSALVLGSGTFAYAVFCASLCAFQAMPFLVDPSRADAADALGTLTSAWFALDGLVGLPLVLALAWAGRATGTLPGPVVAAAAPVGVGLLVMSLGALTTTPAWLAAGGPATAGGFVLFFAWLLAVSIAQLRTE
jgi:hypothetical protein